MKLFRELTPDEEKEFRQWARDNYVPFEPINGTWHPVVQDECVRLNSAAHLRYTFPKDGGRFKR
jgi:hypothetical protein